MERHTVFTDWKTQDNKGVNSLKKKSDLMQFLSKCQQIFIDINNAIPKFI